MSKVGFFRLALHGFFRLTQTFNRFCIVKPDTEVFIYSGRLYIACGYSVVINLPAEQPKFSEEEIKSTIKIEVVEFGRKKGEGKFLTKDNLEKRFELLETEETIHIVQNGNNGFNKV